MADATHDPKRAWLERVLGLHFAVPEFESTAPPTAPASKDDGRGFAELWAEAAARWRDASDNVDTQIGQLQRALKQTDDSELHEIAEFGLNGITGGTKVKLMAAIRELNSAGAALPLAAVGKARQAVAQFRDQINGDGRVDACDENPFGVAMSIRATFAPALAGLESALKAATSGA
jgi:hypothetical protein